MSLRHAAKVTLDLLERGHYVAPSGATVSIADAQRDAVLGTRLLTPEDMERLLALPLAGKRLPRVRVTAETTQATAQRLAEREPVVLNFASARNPGGGFVRGAKAQEEDLCRCSGLYPTLVTQRRYYDANRKQRSLIYTDHAIHSPRVPFFRVRGTDPPMEQPFLASVITMPAPNSGPILRADPTQGPAIAEAFERRWRMVFALARDGGHRTVIVGAWGCGAFGGDPQVAAAAARRALIQASGSLEEVVFAIPAKGKKSTRNLEAFREVLAGAGVG